MTKMKIAAALILTVGVFAAGGTLMAAEQPMPPAGASAPKAAVAQDAAPRQVPKELLEKQLDAVQKVYKGRLERIREGQGLPIELFGWSERWLEAELALRSKTLDRRDALKEHVTRTRVLESMMKKFAAAGQCRQEDADAATYDRVRAEIRYFQATGEMPPPIPGAPPQKKEDKENKQPSQSLPRPTKEKTKDKPKKEKTEAKTKTKRLVDAAPAPEPGRAAKEKLETLKKKLPALVSDWLKENPWKSSQSTFSPELRVMRRVGPDRAKAVILFAAFDKNGAQGRDFDILLNVFLTYQDGSWTTERFEVSMPRHAKVPVENPPNFAFLMLAIDEAAEK